MIINIINEIYLHLTNFSYSINHLKIFSQHYLHTYPPIVKINLKYWSYLMEGGENNRILAHNRVTAHIRLIQRAKHEPWPDRTS